MSSPSSSSPVPAEPLRPPPSGFLLLDKPSGISSHGVVYAVRKAFGLKRGGGDARVGHLGTLDPNATGLLVMVLGSAGRAIEFLGPQDKAYETTVQFGVTSFTDDIWGTPAPQSESAPPLPPHPGPFPTQAEIEAALEMHFRGSRSQLPPTISSVKVAGKRAHRAARAGKPLTLQPRSVELKQCRILRYAPPQLDLAIETSSGYYVRSLARDLGALFGIGGVVTALRRTAVGPWKIADACAIEKAAQAPLHPLHEILLARSSAEMQAAPHGPQTIRAVSAELGEQIAKGLPVELGCERPQGSVWAMHQGTVLAFLLPYGEIHWKPKKVFQSLEEYRAKIKM